MLNLNFNIIECQRRTIAPILANDFNYFLIGGGGGGNFGGGAIGGAGGLGGEFSTGSLSVPHLSTFNITVGTGGLRGTTSPSPIQAATNGGQTILNLNSSLVSFASGGLAVQNTSVSDRGGFGVGSNYDYFEETQWGQKGTKGGDSPTGVNGLGGGTQTNNNWAWTTDPSPVSINGLDNTGGGGAGVKWGEAIGGNGGKGIAVLSFLDPRNVYDYSGTYEYFYYSNGRKYFYFLNNGTFTFLGKKD